jgi:outer membrane murein-binding lipoprotein Lpp
LLRAAAVGGGAYVAGRKMGQRADQQQQSEAEQNQRIDDLEQQQAPEPAAEPAAAAAPSMLDQLNQLTTLHQQGALTDDEFTAAKAKLLG